MTRRTEGRQTMLTIKAWSRTLWTRRFMASTGNTLGDRARRDNNPPENDSQSAGRIVHPKGGSSGRSGPNELGDNGSADANP
jgi:hypothetical protein